MELTRDASTSDELRCTAPALRAEWTKLRTVRSTPWSLCRRRASRSASPPSSAAESETRAGARGGGDDDLVLSLAGRVRPDRRRGARRARDHSRVRDGDDPHDARRQPAAPQVAGRQGRARRRARARAGLATTGAFLIGQPILRGNGFTDDNGYPAASLADGDASRSSPTAVYMALIALLSLGVGAILRHSAGAITVVLASSSPRSSRSGSFPTTSPIRSRRAR